MDANSSTTTGTVTADPVSRNRIAIASLTGTAIEFYDFYLYGTAAALVFNRLFFPSFSSTAGTLAAFATFAAGFVARPIGAILFGHFGDRVGRKSMLIISLMTMGVATVLIGCIPTYDSIGVWAPILLVVCRVLQGIGLGGEWGGAVLLATEYAPEGKRGLYSSFPQLGPAVGFILANGLYLLLGEMMTAQDFDTWGWRLPFLFSAVLIGIGLFIRMRIAETPVFRQAMEKSEPEKIPFVQLLKKQGMVLALATMSFILAHTIFYTTTTFVLSYGTKTLGLAKNSLLICTMIAAVALGIATPLLARWSDSIGRRKVCIGAAAAAMIFAFPMFWLVGTSNLVLIGLAMVLALVIFAALYAPMGAYLPELFETRYRYSGAAFAYSASGIVGGGLSPILATSWTASAGSTWPIATWIAGIALLSLVCLLLLPETRDRDFTAIDVSRTPAAQGRVR